MKYLCECPSVLPRGVLTPNGANISTNVRIAKQILNATHLYVPPTVAPKQVLRNSTFVEIVDNTRFDAVRALNVSGTSLVTSTISGGVYCSTVDAESAVCRRAATGVTTAAVISTKALYRKDATVLRGATLDLTQGVWFITYSVVVPPCAWVHAYGAGREKVGEVLIPNKHEGAVGCSFLYVADGETLSFWAETANERAAGTAAAIKISV